MQKLVAQELEIVSAPPDPESLRIQRMLLDTCICPVLEWSSQAKEQGQLLRCMRLQENVQDLNYHAQQVTELQYVSGLEIIETQVNRLCKCCDALENCGDSMIHG